MYKIKSVDIKGFWGRYNAECHFNGDVNIIIGMNGTGKTTFINILHAVLSVDLDELNNNQFEEITIKIEHGNSKKTIKAQKKEDPKFRYPFVEYTVSTKKYLCRLFPSDDRTSVTYRRRAIEESNDVRMLLKKFVSLSSVSVYRMRHSDDVEVRDRVGRVVMSPVDYRLNQLKSEFTQYQFELSQKARNVSTNLQKDVLTSLLHDRKDVVDGIKIPKEFDAEKERRTLLSAYARLGFSDSDVKKKIFIHIDSINEAIKNLYNSENSEDKSVDIDFVAIEAFARTQRVISFALEAETKVQEIYKDHEMFLKTISDFIPEKRFFVENAVLVVKNSSLQEIPLEKLSSGEKQLLILLIESLLQRKSPVIYITDEPEISLHIEWQRKIIPAIRQLNENSQIIAATHSPEIASKYRGSIINMRSIING